MTDRRTTPDPSQVDRAEAARVHVPVTDLLAAPDGSRDRQLLFGEEVTVLGITGTHAYVRTEKDGYHGFVADRTLGKPRTATHRVSASATHVYSAPDIKSPDRMWLSLGSRLHAAGEIGSFVDTADGFVPVQHLAPVDTPEQDAADVAQRFLGTPYLWGGDSRAGIDCSGLVQAAILACGKPCPRDSDMQSGAFVAVGRGDLRRGDLVFWKGHVGMLLDETRLIHANAHHMAVAIEPLDDAVARIRAKEFGDVTGYARP